MAANQSKLIDILTGMSSQGIERDQQKFVDHQMKAQYKEAHLHHLAAINEMEQRKEDHDIMSMEMSKLTPIQRAYYERFQQQIIARNRTQ